MFPLGCSLCRSERLEKIATNENALSGIKLEKRDSMNERFQHVHGHDIEHELRINRRGNAPAERPEERNEGSEGEEEGEEEHENEQ